MRLRLKNILELTGARAIALMVPGDEDQDAKVEAFILKDYLGVLQRHEVERYITDNAMREDCAGLLAEMDFAFYAPAELPITITRIDGGEFAFQAAGQSLREEMLGQPIIRARWGEARKDRVPFGIVSIWDYDGMRYGTMLDRDIGDEIDLLARELAEGLYVGSDESIALVVEGHNAPRHTLSCKYERQRWCDEEVLGRRPRTRMNAVVQAALAALRVEHETLEASLKDAKGSVQGGDRIGPEDLAAAISEEILDAHGDDQLTRAIVDALAYGEGVY